MPFDSSGPGAIVDVRRIKPITAEWVGDATAGSNANLQTFADARRFLRAKVADVTARNTLTSPQDGDLVLVLNNGQGQTQLDRYYGSTATWATVAVEGGSGGGGSSASPAFKDPVRVATAAALPSNSRAGNVLSASANGALAAIDGVSLSVGDRLLVKNEATGANNGIYTVTSLGGASATWSLTRATDADSDAEMPSGVLVAATEGTANGDTLWQLGTNATITLNTTALAWVRVGANADTLSGASSATAATASTVALRGSDGTLKASNHASLGAAGGAGTAIVADAGGKVPPAAGTEAATASTVPVRGSDGTLKASNHASIGAAGAAGTLVALDASGKVPAAAIPAQASSLDRFIAIGDLASILGTATGGRIIDYVFVPVGFTISAIDVLCPDSPSSGTITIDILRATTTGGAFASLYTGVNTKPSLTCAGSASFATFTGSNLPDTTSIASGSVLAVKITAAPLGAHDLYVTIR